jgi:Fe2+ transport system protein FeoA
MASYGLLIMPRTHLHPAPGGAVRLSQLEQGAQARVLGTDLPGEDTAMLEALGLTDHCLVRVCKTGEPFIVQVSTTRIGLAESVADRILAAPDATA